MLGWTFRGSKYCQHVCPANKIKRLEFAQRYINDDFDDVIWSDESTIEEERHARRAWRKKGELAQPKPRYATRKASVYPSIVILIQNYMHTVYIYTIQLARLLLVHDCVYFVQVKASIQSDGVESYQYEKGKWHCHLQW